MSQIPLICVVDDDESMREALAALIASSGLRVVMFPTARAFLDYPYRSSVSCLIADVQMPNMSGPELYRELAAMGAVIPTILMTGYFDEGIRHQALRDGVLSYLTKPLNEDVLLACICSAVGYGRPPSPLPST